MTKKEALSYFKEFILPHIPNNCRYIDESARREAWNNYTDALCTEGRITLKQYETWGNPF